MQSNMLAHLLFLSIFVCLGIYAQPVKTTTSKITPIQDQETTESPVPKDLNKNGIKYIQIKKLSDNEKAKTSEKSTTHTSVPKGTTQQNSIEPNITEESTPFATESTTEGPGDSQRNPDAIGPRLSATLLKILTK
ncbi:uncharacterized protein DMAD_09744 [Drosophila madeirensis]|uniref:Uncharacterized protein n=1 Tax=Drosophila madeirensis TaxID=30013 RepID=A0AAU9EX70_DROMD